MGERFPYIYAQRPVDHDFNPREYSEKARWSAASAYHDRSERQGPLLDFNRHPDTWMVVTPTFTDSNISLPKHFKRNVIVTRWLQLTLRVVQLLASIGLFICVICIKGTAGSQSWILRIPPPVDSLVSCYAIYHLCRPAGSRTPASSASYHWFALLMDAGFVPFFVYTILFARANYVEPASSQDRWTSVMATEGSTDAILLTSWITSTILAGTHLISGILDIFLGWCFRKITMMPPDCNPLAADDVPKRSERVGGHKHKTSDLHGANTDGEKMASSLYAGSSKTSVVSSHASIHCGLEQHSSMVPFAATRVTSSPQPGRNVRPCSSHRSIRSHASQYPANRSSTSGHSSSGTRASSRSRYRQYQAPGQSMPPPLPQQTACLQTSNADDSHDSLSRSSSPSSPAASMTPRQRDLLKDNWFRTHGQQQPDLSRELASAKSFDNPVRQDQGETPENEQFHDEVKSPSSDIPVQHYHDVRDQPLRSHQPDLPVKAQYVPLPSQMPNHDQMRIESDAANGEEIAPEGDVGRALTMGSSIYTESVMSPPEDCDVLGKNRYYGALGSSNIHLMDVPLRERDANRNTSTGAEVVERAGLAASRSRMASGKIVEEGRGGWMMRRREVSGAIPA